MTLDFTKTKCPTLLEDYITGLSSFGIWMLYSALEPDWDACKKKRAVRLLNAVMTIKSRGDLV